MVAVDTNNRCPLYMDGHHTDAEVSIHLYTLCTAFVSQFPSSAYHDLIDFQYGVPFTGMIFITNLGDLALYKLETLYITHSMT